MEKRVVTVFLEFLQILLAEDIFRRVGDLDVEVDPVGPMVEIIPSQHLVEQTAERPDVRGPGGPNLLPSVVVVGLLLEVEGKGQHFWGFDALGAP